MKFKAKWATPFVVSIILKLPKGRDLKVTVVYHLSGCAIGDILKVLIVVTELNGAKRRSLKETSNLLMTAMRRISFIASRTKNFDTHLVEQQPTGPILPKIIF